MSDVRPGSRRRTRLRAHDGDRVRERVDVLAVEEPLEIRLAAGGQVTSLAVTMRTPGSDFELAAGFLLAEGVVAAAADIQRIAYCVDRDLDEDQRHNVVTVTLDRPSLPDTRLLHRNVTTTSACGVCGRTSIESIAMRGTPPVAGEARIDRTTLARLPARLRESQPIFERTGGLHAAAMFESDGRLVAVREDVGRHNALDKLIGWALTQRRLPLRDHVLLVSGRASYELVQKAVTAGASMLCAISAPSSLAVDLAREFDLTLVGFLRGETFNVYAGERRISAARTVVPPP